MSLVDTIRNDLKDSMRAKDETRTSAIRLLLAAMKDEESAKRQRALDQAVKAAGVELKDIPPGDLPAEEALTEAEMQQVVAREIKKRQDAADAFSKAGRDDLAGVESGAISFLRGYLPAQMSPEEARAAVATVIDEVGSGSKLGPADMKRVMPVVMQRFKDRADGRMLNQLVREMLGA